MHVPGFRALQWWDNKAVYMLASGGSVALDRVVRRNRLTGEQAEVACPRVLKDYQTLMGGVDIHGQFRLQRYSLQLAIKYKKYYKSLFLGLIDLALINAYIVHNAGRASDGMRKLGHVKFMKQLHLELCQLREEGWEALLSSDSMEGTPSKARPKAWRVFLCDKVRHEHNGRPMSCFDIWHKAWRNGTALPSKARKRKIRARTPAKTPAEGSINNNAGSSDDSTSSPHHQKQARRAETAD
ncbi:Hypothetical protein PHPALM_11741 [Phytophthora palmivora]|uniref:PiggyBac transposable element-derived protein domain-containing protein n=1 Tax=Phytophthora palmivora TaxID=4796 RepID=A0A2P4Y1I0_9STRA|nr:Hypothetical protein PHPALM_11741 [Phytophthora palmivora]